MPMTYPELERTFGTAWHPAAKEIFTALAEKTNAGDPTNTVTPDFQGQFCRDTSNSDLYWASSLLSSGWKKLNN